MKKAWKVFATLALCLPALTFAAGQITEAKLGKGIAERMITEEASGFAAGEKAYLWMRVMDATGETLVVTWKTGDQSFQSSVNIGGSPWRTWANKTLHIVGEWTVTVNDTAGNILHETKLNVQ
ncbi:MAG: DUF2914 domain-containing protein [Burkholderiales bacterium]